MSDDPTIGFLKADVARFCAGLDELPRRSGCGRSCSCGPRWTR
ncbi:hypothetical protein AAH978_08045 [Streptomyces sp. ZYX-F-203]